MKRLSSEEIDDVGSVAKNIVEGSVENSDHSDNNLSSQEVNVDRAMSVFSSLIKLKEEKGLDKKAWIEIYKILKKGDSTFSVNRGGPLFDSKKYLDKPHIIDELEMFINKNSERQKYLKSLCVPQLDTAIQEVGNGGGGGGGGSGSGSGSGDGEGEDTKNNESYQKLKNEKKMLFRLDVEQSETPIPLPSTKTENEYHAYLLKKIKKCGNKSVIHHKLKAATSYNPSGTGTFSAPIQDDELDDEEDGDEVKNSDDEHSSLDEYTDDIEPSLSEYEEGENEEYEESEELQSEEGLGEEGDDEDD